MFSTFSRTEAVTGPQVTHFQLHKTFKWLSGEARQHVQFAEGFKDRTAWNASESSGSSRCCLPLKEEEKTRRCSAAPLLRDRPLVVTYRLVLAATRTAVRRQRLVQYMLTRTGTGTVGPGVARSKCLSERDAGKAAPPQPHKHMASSPLLTYPQCITYVELLENLRRLVRRNNDNFIHVSNLTFD